MPPGKGSRRNKTMKKILTLVIALALTFSAVPAIAAPVAPVSLSATAVSATQINLTWASSTDPTIIGFRIVRGSAQIATTSASSTGYNDTGLQPLTLYNYTVKSFDASSTESAATTSATTLADTTAPSAPTGLSATPVSTSQINLAWTAATDNVAVAGYKVFRNASQIATTTGLSYPDTGLAASTTYGYAVSAFDAAGNVSTSSLTSTATTFATGTPPIATTTARIRVIGNGNDGRLINLRSNAKIKVVVFGGSSFKVKDIDKNTVTFAGAPAINNWRQWHNRDWFVDRVFEFRARDMKDLLDLATTTTSAEVSFKATVAGTPIEIKTTVRVKNIQKWHEDRDREHEREDAREALKKEQERIREAAKDALEKQREALKDQQEKMRENAKNIRSEIKSIREEAKSEIKNLKNEFKYNKSGKGNHDKSDD